MALKVIIELHKQYRPQMQPEVLPFIDLNLQIHLTPLPRSLHEDLNQLLTIIMLENTSGIFLQRLFCDLQYISVSQSSKS